VRDALVHDDRIEVAVEAEPISVPVDTAIPLGMVVNELVTNAVKYAYPLGATGQILVRSSRDGDQLLLSVQDFGQGLPSEAESRTGGGLGMKLVKALVAQIDGHLATLGPPGAGFEIRVPTP
jgi:two-component sensor histidine kinase